MIYCKEYDTLYIINQSNGYKDSTNHSRSGCKEYNKIQQLTVVVQRNITYNCQYKSVIAIHSNSPPFLIGRQAEASSVWNALVEVSFFVGKWDGMGWTWGCRLLPNC